MMPWEASPWVQAARRREAEAVARGETPRPSPLNGYGLGQVSDDTECARELAVSIIASGGAFRVGDFGARLAATHGDTQRIADTVGIGQGSGIVGQGPTSKYALDRALAGETVRALPRWRSALGVCLLFK